MRLVRCFVLMRVVECWPAGIATRKSGTRIESRCRNGVASFSAAPQPRSPKRAIYESSLRGLAGDRIQQKRGHNRTLEIKHIQK